MKPLALSPLHREDRTKRAVRSFFAFLLSLVIVLGMAVPAYATGATMTIGDIMDAYEGQLPDWDSLQNDCEVSEEEQNNGELEPRTKAARYLATVFASKADYLKWKDQADKYVDYDEETGSVGPKVNEGGNVSASNEQNYNRTQSNFDKAVSKSSIKDLTYDIFGLDDWNPNNKFTTAFMDGFKAWINRYSTSGRMCLCGCSWSRLCSTVFTSLSRLLEVCWICLVKVTPHRAMAAVTVATADTVVPEARPSISSSSRWYLTKP